MLTKGRGAIIFNGLEDNGSSLSFSLMMVMSSFFLFSLLDTWAPRVPRDTSWRLLPAANALTFFTFVPALDSTFHNSYKPCFGACALLCLFVWSLCFRSTFNFA